VTKINSTNRLKATRRIGAGNEAAIEKQKILKAETLKVLKAFEAQNPAMKVWQGKDTYGDIIYIRICDNPSLVTRFRFDYLQNRHPDYANPGPSIKTMYLAPNGHVIHYDTAWYNYSSSGFPRTLKDIRDLKKTFPIYAERVIETHKEGNFHYGHD
jgi:hypothetical protein